MRREREDRISFLPRRTIERASRNQTMATASAVRPVVLAPSRVREERLARMVAPPARRRTFGEQAVASHASVLAKTIPEPISVTTPEPNKGRSAGKKSGVRKREPPPISLSGVATAESQKVMGEIERQRRSQRPASPRSAAAMRTRTDLHLALRSDSDTRPRQRSSAIVPPA